MNDSFDPSKFTNYHSNRKQFARKLRIYQTPAEVLLWEKLRKDQLGYRFLRQKPLGPYIADFYCAQVKLCIELDGSSHDDKQEYDEVRSRYLSEQKIFVMRFTNDEIEQDIDLVVSEILLYIHKCNS